MTRYLSLAEFWYFRPPDEGEFSDRDVAVLNTLGPYLAMRAPGQRGFSSDRE